MNRLVGKVAFITGASRGIGRAIAETFLEEGAKVALCSRSAGTLEALADGWNTKGRRALAIECDVTSEESVKNAVEELERAWGQLHIVVNNAGVSGRTPVTEDSLGSWQRILDTNLTGAFLVSQKTAELISGGGRVVNISSILGRFGVPGYAAYCASKHGLIGLTRSLALELAPRRITVNAICPGWVETDMADAGIRDTAEAIGIAPEAFKDRAVEDIPLRRFLEPAEVATLALYLASDDAAMITGQTYNISGGQVMS